MTHLCIRDLKPANILISLDGVIKIGDLGLVSIKQGTRQYNTRRPTAGTAQYMAPECYNHEPGQVTLTDR